MRIALIQQHATREKRINVERALDALRRAADDGAQCTCFAELGFEWFHPQQPAPLNVADLAETVPGPTTEAFCAVLRERSLVPRHPWGFRYLQLRRQRPGRRHGRRCRYM